MANIKLTNSILIDESSLQIHVDTSNVIATVNNSYTANQNCFVCAGVTNQNYESSNLAINGVQSSFGSDRGANLNFFAVSGTKVTLTNGGEATIKAFGLK